MAFNDAIDAICQIQAAVSLCTESRLIFYRFIVFFMFIDEVPPVPEACTDRGTV